MTIEAFYHLELSRKKELLERCCGSSVWVEKMCKMPIAENMTGLLEQARAVWSDCSENDWKDAFLHHPKIGDVHALRQKFSSDQFAANEQNSVSHATEETLHRLAEANRVYEEKFGYIFIVCATGKSAEEMLALLTIRLQNSPGTEIKIAMEEQNKITKLRLEKLLSNRPS